MPLHIHRPTQIAMNGGHPTWCPRGSKDAFISFDHLAPHTRATIYIIWLAIEINSSLCTLTQHFDGFLINVNESTVPKRFNFQST